MLHQFDPCYAGPVYIREYEALLCPQMPRRQIGAEPSVNIVVFHVKCSMSPWRFVRFTLGCIEILSIADDNPGCRLLFGSHRQHVEG